MEKHTEGKLQVEFVGDTGGENPVHVCEIGNDHIRVAEYITEANARRLVACWNACNGIGTDELEKIEVKRNMRVAATEYAALSAERDALLRDKAELVRELERCNAEFKAIATMDKVDCDEAIRKTGEIIAKHGGEK